MFLFTFLTLIWFLSWSSLAGWDFSYLLAFPILIKSKTRETRCALSFLSDWCTFVRFLCTLFSLWIKIITIFTQLTVISLRSWFAVRIIVNAQPLLFTKNIICLAFLACWISTYLHSWSWFLAIYIIKYTDTRGWMFLVIGLAFIAI